MNKSLIYALVLIALLILVLLKNTSGSIGVDLLLADISASKPLVLLGFTGLGLAIGVLLK